ncbi:MAG: hypothetical protein RL095_2101 [Verrucomicrobiota bacterium]|jgi:hypothetical protein
MLISSLVVSLLLQSENPVAAEGQWSSPKTGALGQGESALPVQGPFGPGCQTLSFKELPKHQALKLEFTLHLTGGWDGVGPWGPDRWVCGLKGGGLFLDTTFNNCFQVWSDNINQSFPESYFLEAQEDCARLPPKGLLPCSGGTGASAFGRFGPRIHGKTADSSYTFSFIVRHDAATAEFLFHSLCEDPIPDEQWWLGAVKVTPLAEVPGFTPAEAEGAWSAIFSGDAHQSFRSQQFFITHPEELLRRAKLFATGSAEYGRSRLALTSAAVPPDGLRRPVETSDAGRSSLAAWRELSMLSCRNEVTQAALKETDLPLERQLWLRTLRSQLNLGAPQELALLRLQAQLRQQGSAEALSLADAVKDKIQALRRSEDSDD